MTGPEDFSWADKNLDAAKEGPERKHSGHGIDSVVHRHMVQDLAKCFDGNFLSLCMDISYANARSVDIPRHGFSDTHSVQISANTIKIRDDASAKFSLRLWLVSRITTNR